MKSTILFRYSALLLLQCLISTILPGQTPPGKQWDKRFGGSDYDGWYFIVDQITRVITTSDGGYLIGGSSISDRSGDKSQNSKRNTINDKTYDYWIVKTDASGVKQWDSTYGGNDQDFLTCIQQTTDKGYILGGYSSSNASGDKSESGRGGYDYWILKIDSNGRKQWDKTFGGNSSDFLYAIQQTSDGGYILAGYSLSDATGEKSDANYDPTHNTGDYWIVKIKSNRQIEWNEAYGGSAADVPHSIIQNSDGDYLVGGQSNSDVSGNKGTPRVGDYDYWAIKLSRFNGGKVWEKDFGGHAGDNLTCLQQTIDGGYILGGWSLSLDYPHIAYWIIKLFENGDEDWNKFYTSNRNNYLQDIHQTNDGGYILGGYSNADSSADKTEHTRGGYDFWIVKTDLNGAKQWDKTFGGNEDEFCFSVHQTPDGGYISGGVSFSDSVGDKTQRTRGGWDYWVVKQGFQACIQSVFYHDSDNDGYGNLTDTIHACSVPAGYVTNSTDCNDNPATGGASVHPGATEVCNGIDDDCDGQIDAATFQAEDAFLNGAVKASNKTGFTGSGFADYINASGDFIQWTVDASAAGSYSLQFRYANGGATNRPLRLEVNGAVVDTSLDFPSTGNWTTWAVSSATASLVAGANTVRLTAIGSSGPNVDHLTVTIIGCQPGLLEAELAVLSGAVVASKNPGFTGSGYADYINASNDFIQWTYNASAGGSYSLQFRYANGGTANRPLKLEVNGVMVADSLAFSSTGSWTIWAVSSATASLVAGANTVRLTAIGSSGPNVDHLKVEIVPCQAGTFEAELAVLSGAVVASKNPGFTSSGYADYINASNDFIQWTYNASAAGSYSLQFRYANGGTANRPLKLEVNGVMVADSLAFSSTGSWTIWAVSSATASLVAGANTVRLTAIGSSGPNVDHLKMELIFYHDADSDGFGSPLDTVHACIAPAGFVSNSTDCNDNNAGIHPGAAEVCNGVDDNCDGEIDEGFDQDGDSYTTCDGDCDDSNADINPGATEVCGDGIDNNCNGNIDEDCNCPDPDSDGDGYTTCDGDCDDGNVDVNPGAEEICDGIDNNCNGEIDEGFDQDGDGFTTCNGDCDDGNPDVNPGILEICDDGIDNDCNGVIDDWWLCLVDRPSGRPSSVNIKTDKKTVTLKLVPNPARNILNVYTTGLPNNKKVMVSIISASGVLIKTMQSAGSTQVIRLDVSSLVSGVYTIKVISGDRVTYKQFVKL